ncbi:EAL domain-containing protein [Actinomycetospora sp. TBRC 11914]|uniref:EAL domain-containing protein n=1 Tax=Actinomycetospora sp. TBRC 11914 TaxID=2729387 RepID=UPI00145F4863|nr:EAL domain-containing protein [Actinomycetospora sp. TBRC 11914]NMO93266.1 EAL domain-containing protein [Actinomycetospora sp. TBRC 11914]
MSDEIARDRLDALLRERAVDPVYQPIVDLDTGDVVGLEALARGPLGGPLERPDALFAAARAAGRLAELDSLCRGRAVQDAYDAGLAGPLALFVNVEPLTVATRLVPFTASGDLAERGVHVVAEFTERDLTADPARLFAFADQVRAHGFHIALDDVGAHPASLALMPFLRPEVVKLDLRLVQARPGPEVAEIMSAVAAYAEQSGALVLAEGVENPDHFATARSLGATLGQGWWFGAGGRAAEILPGLPSPRRAPAWQRPVPPVPRASPFATVARARTPRRATSPLLLSMSRFLERQAAEMGELAVVVAAFERAPHFTRATRARYRELARSAAYVGVLGAGMAAEPEPGVRGADLAPDDPVRQEWIVAVVGPHFAAALVSRDLDPATPSASSDLDRSFDYVLTHDRALVLDVARSLLARTVPVDADHPDPHDDAEQVGVPLVSSVGVASVPDA